MRVSVAPFAVALLFFPAAAVCQQVPSSHDATEFLIKALELQGRNPTVISSGSFEVVVEESTEPRSAASVADQTSKAVADLQRAAESAKSDIEREHWLALSKQLATELPATIRESEKQRWAVTIKFNGNNPRSESIETHRLLSGVGGSRGWKWSVLSVPNGPRDTSFVQSYEQTHEATVQTNGLTTTGVEQFGRARSPMALLLTTVLLGAGGDPTSLTFNPAVINAVRQLFDQVAADPRLGESFAPHVTSVRDFEGSRVYEIQCGQPLMPAGVTGSALPRMLKLSVDPGRGYIVPLEEEYTGGKLRIRFESSGFALDARSGVWFPRRCVDTYFDPTTGRVSKKSVYEFTKVSINEPVDSREFVIRMPPGSLITDNRTSPAVQYRASQEIPLRFIGGRLLLGGAPGLAVAETLKGQHLPEASSNAGVRRFCIICTAGIVALLAALAIRRRVRA